MRGEVTAIVGAQYGSEGKGAIVQSMARQYNVHVRTGGPNAGHTIYYQGKEFKMQVIPCGWINLDAQLVIGIGALVDIEQLQKEVKWIKPYDPLIESRIFIDAKAGHLSPVFKNAEGGTSGAIHQRIGSTGKGVGAARGARMERDNVGFDLLENADLPNNVRSMLHHDTSKLLHRCMSDGDWILLEGAQGAGLSLIHGTWPYVTSADTNAAQMLADSGLPPKCLTSCILVARTYPIRVAGNSGPLNEEVDWDYMSERIGEKVEERTTVTNKVRRIGKWDSDLFIRAVRLNQPTSIALTFMDYLYPENVGIVDFADLSPGALEFIDFVETLAAPAPVRFVGTGPMKGEADIGMIDRGGFA